MSVRMDLYLVDWEAFRRKVPRGMDQDDWDEDWESWSEVELATLSDPSAQAPRDFLDAFDAFKRPWKDDRKLHFKEVFETLFWAWRSPAHRIVDLEQDACELMGIETALQPESVGELIRSGDQIHLELCRDLFQAHVREIDRFPSFEEWRDYGEEWLALLRRASRSDRGLIVAAFG